MRARLILAVSALLVTMLAFAGTAMATTRWVNDNGTLAPAPGTSCLHPGYNTIQDAEAASIPGDIIRVCAGSYTGPVVVDVPNVTLRGQKWGVDARTRTQTGESNVTDTTLGFDLQADNVVLDGFRVRNVTGGPGIQTSPDHSGYQILNNVVRDNVFGIYANTGAANQNLIRWNLIRNNNRPGSAAENGIYTDQGLENILIRNNTFRGQLGTAINLVTGVGKVNDNVTIRSNFGLNNASFVLTQGSNSDLDILSNTTNDTVLQREWGGCQIRIDGDAEDVLISSNTIRNAPFAGICLRDAGAAPGAGPVDVDVNFNRILGSDFWGIHSNDGVLGAASLNGNIVRDAAETGIQFDQNTHGNTITNNDARRNEPDCADFSQASNFPTEPPGTAGTANFWTNNIGGTAIPRGICRRPS